jgi:hypothetical protein
MKVKKTFFELNFLLFSREMKCVTSISLSHFRAHHWKRLVASTVNLLEWD